jgi:hypothetical protein
MLKEKGNMIIKKALFFTLSGILLLTSCGPDVPVSPDNTLGDIPILDDPLITVHPNMDQIHLQVKGSDDKPGSQLSVYSRVFLTGSDSVWLFTELNDRGEKGDQIPNDGYFGITVDTTISDTASGMLTAQFFAIDSDDNMSDTVLAFWNLSKNTPPYITNVWSPDTVMRPDPGLTDTFVVRVQAHDNDGLKDIIAVFFQVRSVDDTTVWNSNPLFVLNDAGIGADRVSGDGIYSTSLTISWENRLVDNIFRYYALDWSGNMSEFVLDTITVYKDFIPEIHNFFLGSSSQITKPTEGSPSDSVLFYVNVSDENGLEEITSVHLLRKNPAGSWNELNFPRGYDDGLHDDFSAGDGWFTVTSGFGQDDETGSYYYRAVVTDAFGNYVLSTDSIAVDLIEAIPSGFIPDNVNKKQR